jgi:hypothetical protein
VPRLCLLEKGYSDEEYAIKNVDISEPTPAGTSIGKFNR